MSQPLNIQKHYAIIQNVTRFGAVFFLGGCSMMISICSWLANHLNTVIFMGGLIDLFFLIISGCRLCILKIRINNLNRGERKKDGIAWKSGKGKVASQYIETIDRDWSKFDLFRDDYQKGLTLYNASSLFIQTFPLLGILGTVSGLYIAINTQQERFIYSGVGFALESTIYGIVCAVILKFVEIFITALFVNYIDDGIDRYEKGYSVANEEVQHNISREVR